MGHNAQGNWHNGGATEKANRCHKCHQQHAAYDQGRKKWVICKCSKKDYKEVNKRDNKWVAFTCKGCGEYVYLRTY
jgi:hypothetical protein